MEKQTFKQYLESKEQLLRAIENTPISTTSYDVKKYCTLTLGESEDEKVLIGLKPKFQVIVEWSHADVHNPTPESVRIVGSKDVDSIVKHEVFWTGNKLQKWLMRHTTKGDQYV